MLREVGVGIGKGLFGGGWPRKAREQAGLTQGQVAERLDIYASFIPQLDSSVELADLCSAGRVGFGARE